MIIKSPRNSHKEYTTFENHVMSAEKDINVLWSCTTRELKKQAVKKLFNWVSKDRIIEIKMWHSSKNSIESVKINNFHNKIVTIRFRLDNFKPQHQILEVDDITGD